jgi:hypothetical protein
MKWLTWVLLLCSVATGQSQSTETQNKTQLPEEFKHFATRPCLPMYGKGGVGIVNERLFVLTKTPYNELILRTTKDGPDHQWRGKTASEVQVVFIFEDRVWEAKSLPKNFNLAISVVISFEKDKIRVFSFQDEQGCYYLHKNSSD